MGEAGEREYFARVHGVEHRHQRVVVLEGAISANHGLISAVVELHLCLNYSNRWRRVLTLKRYGTDIPGPQPSLTTEHIFQCRRRSAQCRVVPLFRSDGTAYPPAFRTTLR